VDLLDPAFHLRFYGSGRTTIDVPPHWLRWLVPAS
jgi:hypothetical protein